jgi:two-component system, sensor histidine kinase and response regulator
MSDPTQRATILVVDDEPLNRRLVRAILGDIHHIVEAPDAETGLQIVAGGDIDLVLLDVQMPGMNGFDACQKLKREYASPFLPVLLLTALSDKDSRLRGFEAGADDFLSKPIDHRELVLRTRAFLRLRFQDERIRAQLDELQRLDQLKDDLAALVVHDMRNPLAGLDGLLYVLAESSTGENAEIIGEALTASRHLRGAVEDLLKIRLLEQNELTLAREPVELRSVAEQAVATLEGDARMRGLRIQVNGNGVTVAADAPLLRRAIENLLANALRYTRPRTTVDVEVTCEDDSGEIAVADRGPGVPDDQKEQVFTKYRRAVETRTPPQRVGTGLGLYLVKLASEAHGGRVTVEDRPEGGAVFRIKLPREPAA